VQVAGKTGTSDDLRDSWFAGFSADIVAVVWTGFDDNQPTSLTGSSGAMRVWQNIIKHAAYASYYSPEMSTTEKHWIDLENGLLSDDGCENAVELSFIVGSQPQQESDCSNSDSTNWFYNIFN
ncbi:MAG: penicillin-binding protein 1B, partial [Gammaproteobacteria bacterium]|nr:penicillin-binding protein 1B [Gammaproteobacteria bacterium]